MLITEADIIKIIENSLCRILKEDDSDGIESYTHFAINKQTGAIVNGWDYHGYESSELRGDKNYYFFDDLKDYGLDPREYTIISKKVLLRRGIDPSDQANWSNE